MANKSKDIILKINEPNQLGMEILSKKKAHVHAELAVEYLKFSKYTNKQKREIINKIITLAKDEL